MVSGGTTVVSTGTMVVSATVVSTGTIVVSVVTLSVESEAFFVELHAVVATIIAPAKARLKINFFIGMGFNYLIY